MAVSKSFLLNTLIHAHKNSFSNEKKACYLQLDLLTMEFEIGKREYPKGIKGKMQEDDERPE